MRTTQLVDVTLRVGVEVEDDGYPDLAGRLAEMEAERFAQNVTAATNLNRLSRLVKGAKVVSVAVWDSNAIGTPTNANTEAP